MREILAASIFLATIAVIIARPSNVPEWAGALGGALALIALGVEPARAAVSAAAAQWNVLLFFAGLMIMVAVAEQAGFFAWVSAGAARAARGSSGRLFAAVIGSGALISVLLTNDAAALVMTPLVYATVRHLRLRAAPFAYACTFIANGASIALPISNPINFVIAGAARLRLAEYLALLWLPALASAAATALVLWALFRRQTRGRFDPADLPPSAGDPRYRIEVTGAVLAGAALLVLASAAGWAVGAAACAVAATLLVHGAAVRRLDLGQVAREANPSILVLVASLFVVIDAVERSGLLAGPAVRFTDFVTAHGQAAAPLAAVGAALAANLFNNLPAALVAVATIQGGHFAAPVAARLAAGAIVGCDLGPNLTTVGSLSTMLWLVLLRRRGMEISTFEYLKIGIAVAPASLAAALGALLLVAR